jgi:hypothetical protein
MRDAAGELIAADSSSPRRARYELLPAIDQGCSAR